MIGQLMQGTVQKKVDLNIVNTVTFKPTITLIPLKRVTKNSVNVLYEQRNVDRTPLIVETDSSSNT